MQMFANIELGFSPILNIASDGTREVLQVAGWTGGFGSAPSTGMYLGSAGYVANITDGVNIRGGGVGGGVAISGGTNSFSTGTIIFSNSNGITFGMNTDGVMTGSVATNYQSQGAYLTTAMLSNAGSNFVGLNSALTGNGVSATINSSGISLNVPAFLTTAQPVGAYLTTAMLSNAATISNIKVSAGTLSALRSDLSFNNSNGVSFGLETNGIITATVKTDYQTSGAYLTTAMASNRGSDFVQATAAFAGTNASGTIASNGISVSVNAQSAVPQNVSLYALGNTTQNSSTQLSVNALSFNAIGSITMGYSNGSIQVSAPNALTTAMQSNAATISNINVSAGTTSNNLSALTFSNLNGVTFGLNGSVVTASVAAAGGAQTGISGIIVSDTTYTSGTVSYRDGNGISFASTTGQGISITHGLQFTSNTSNITSNAVHSTAARIQGVIGSNTTYTSGSIGLRDLNGITWQSTTGQSFQITHDLQYTSNTSNITSNALNTSASRVINIIAATNNTGGGTASLSSNISFSNANGITFYTSAGNAIVASYNSTQFLTTARASNDAIGLNTALTANGVSWTVNSSGLSLNIPAFLTTAALSNHSHNFATTTTNGANIVVGTTNSAGATIGVPNFLTTAMASNAATISNVNISAGTTSSNLSAFVFSNSNGVSFGLNGSTVTASVNAGGGGIAASISGNSTSGGAGYSNITSGTMILAGGPNITLSQDGSRISISANNPGAAAENNYINLLGANTAGNTTASGTTIGWSGQGVTLSGANGSQVVISAPATSSISGTGQISISVNGSTISIGVPNAVTVSRYNEFKESPLVVGQQGQGTLHLQPWLIPNLQMDRVILHLALSNSSNSSGSGTLSNWVGIYTKNDSTLSLLHSVSASTAFTMSGTAGSYSLFGGIRQLSMGLTQTLTEGMYWIGVINRTTTGGTNMSISQLLNSNINSNFSGEFGVASNATNALSLGFGVYSASTTAMPASIGFTQVRGSASLALRPPSIYFVSGTI